ncbi:MAG: RNA methyltransferase [Pseudomonadota bacterium]
MAIIRISDLEDPRLAPYTSIREKDLTKGHGGRFIVEGKVTLATLVQRSSFEIESLFLTESRLQPLSNLIEDLPGHVPIFVAAQSLMDHVAGFPVHRGVLACGVKGVPLGMEEVLRTSKTILVLIGLSNHDNVGACFRNATAFGADAILLDDQSCGPLYRKSIRVSAGTALTLPFVYGSSAQGIFQSVSRAGFDLWCLTPRLEATPISRLTRPDKLALVLGSEGPGLSDDLLGQGTPVRIPMVDDFDSINVATAGAIALSQVFKHFQAHGVP